MGPSSDTDTSCSDRGAVGSSSKSQPVSDGRSCIRPAGQRVATSQTVVENSTLNVTSQTFALSKCLKEHSPFMVGKLHSHVLYGREYWRGQRRVIKPLSR